MPVNSLTLFAPDCSSWGIPARGSSKRSYINSAGNLFSEWVRSANTMVARSLGFVISMEIPIDHMVSFNHSG